MQGILVLFFSILFCSPKFCDAGQNETVNIGVILDSNSLVGKVAKTAIQLAVDEVNKDTKLLKGTRLVVTLRDSQGDPIEGASAAVDMLKREVVAIIGPQKSEVAEFVAQLGDAAQVPIISFSVTNPLLSMHRYPYFVRMARNDSLQMQAIAELHKAYDWRRVVAIYPDDDFGTGLIANPHEEKAEINLYGLFAYDTISMIGRAIGNLLSKEPHTRFNFSRTSKSIENESDLTDIKVFQEGPKLLQEIHNTKFSGISGAVQLQDGEIMGSTYEIVNVIGKSYRVVGYWSSYWGIWSLSYSNHINNNPVSSANLGTVIWPGGSTAEPRGWVIPTSGKKLRIGVPAKNGFNQFVTVSFDRVRNVSHVEGFCKDVFDAVLKRLDYALPYDLIPYGDGNVKHSYDDLVNQAYLKNFDAVVGDITILAKRSKYVDFTQPFTESGIVMVVLIKTDEADNAWAFMLPFTPGMWCATGAFFIFTGVVVWLLEHKKNPVFRGNPRSQVVTLLWFSFSTLFFVHRERIVSSLARMVTIIWLFVVLILTSSYTASLTSILTVQQMKPTITRIISESRRC